MSHAEYQKQWYHNHPGYYTNYKHEKYLKNKAEILQQQKKYNQSSKGKIVHRRACYKYDHSEKGKKKKQEWAKKHKSDSDAKHYQKNKEKIKKRVANYKKTANGKLSILRHHYKRHKNMNTIKLFENPFDESEIIDWHHINSNDVVALPRDFHRHFQGKFHRENLDIIINQIYKG